MTRAQLIEYRNEIAKSLADSYRAIRISQSVAPNIAPGMILLANLHDVFCRQLDQSFFEPVSTLHEITVMETINVLHRLYSNENVPNEDIYACIERLNRILPKQPAAEGDTKNASGDPSTGIKPVN